MNLGAGSEIAIDVDEADMSILDENLKSTDELTATLSAKLHRVSTSSALAIKSINPLMVKINRLKVQQRNFQNVFKLVENIRDYAEEISSLDKSMSTFSGLNSVSQITSFCNIVDKYQRIQHELESRNLNDFEGLRKGLDSSLRDADVTLKFEFINKLKTLSKRLKSNGNKYGKEEDDIIVQLKLMYDFMKRSRAKNMLDTLIKERADYNLSTLRALNLDLPTLVKDQTYYYDGDKNQRYFVNYSKTLQTLSEDST
ncbi:hypothetical protein KL905_003755 [Ogataea polymorpha]|nr:hypothetical protein KL937_000022 [Ogataea polymorpha]KAG7889715.1 hypothetical protein KL908_004828 [Ogataea polymorpha]KAG7895536.1 hypothetical protein KL936_000244 [Ogataea polymorpha]KAG7898403.1 hypothetical protein KL907_005303 [Ogataea polymorpha]KAG7904389.1 hypothetical protein KL935_000528 [Ogataea polymorpha]